jgi:hypothetical protein
MAVTIMTLCFLSLEYIRRVLGSPRMMIVYYKRRLLPDIQLPIEIVFPAAAIPILISLVSSRSCSLRLEKPTWWQLVLALPGFENIYKSQMSRQCENLRLHDC